LNGQFGLAHPGKDDGAQAEGENIRVAELQCTVEQLERLNRIMLVQRDDMRRGCKHRCVVATEDDSLARMLNRCNAIFLV